MSEGNTVSPNGDSVNRKEIKVEKVSDSEIFEKNKCGVCVGAFSLAELSREGSNNNATSSSSSGTTIVIDESETARYNTSERLFNEVDFNNCFKTSVKQGKSKDKKDEKRQEDDGDKNLDGKY